MTSTKPRDPPSLTHQGSTSPRDDVNGCIAHQTAAQLPGMRARRATWTVLVATVLACGPSQLRPNEPAQAKLTQTTLEFPDTYLGAHPTQPLDVTNLGGQRGTFATSVDAPFTLDVDALTLGPGEGAQLQVHFTPLTVGSFTGVLHVADAQVEVHARALAIPQCEASTSCTSNTFDPNRAQCLAVSQPDGTSCQSACVLGGACLSGACAGQQVNCDDANACTIDACSDEAGCVHEPRSCEAPANPCVRATCDATTGCGLEVLADAELCGPNDCLRDEVHVCITGQCVTRPRAGGSSTCHDQWVPLTMSLRSGPIMAWDGARRQTVLFGGLGTREGTLNETWVWDGQRWTQLHPLSSPPARSWGSLAYDSDRERLVLFGGAGTTATLADTWEWDGRDWLQRRVQGPSARWGASMAYDSARKRTVLFGGGGLDDTWEWDGTRWSHRTAITSPPGRTYGALAFDPVRGRSVLFGGFDMNGWLEDTWEWDGSTWTRAHPSRSPGHYSNNPMTWNPVRQRCLLVGQGLWEWDGTSWTQLESTAKASAVAWDAQRGRAVLYDGDGTNRPSTTEWDEQSWYVGPAAPFAGAQHWLSWNEALHWGVLLNSSAAVFVWDGAWHESPTGGVTVLGLLDATTFDNTRDQLVAVGAGGFPTSPELTWTLDVRDGWREYTGARPPARSGASLTWDAAREKVVLFGGITQQSPRNDTWEWDGSGWLQRAPAHAPEERADAALAYDVARGRVVLFGGQATGNPLGLGDTWEWDGLDWTRKSGGPAPPPRFGASLAYDPVRRRVVLFGGASFGVGLFNDTWEWDGTMWTRRQLTRSPPGRSFAGMMYDQVRGRMMLFGGGDDSTWFLLP